jgi:hypothetical protein
VSDPERTIDVAWAQQELNLTSRLRLSGGVRYDHYSDFGDSWSPKAEIVFTLAPEQRLRGSYGQGFRPPYFGELYLDTPPFFVGNPELVRGVGRVHGRLYVRRANGPALTRRLSHAGGERDRFLPGVAGSLHLP